MTFSTDPAMEPVPPVAADVFEDRLPLARRYAELLCSLGVERGLIGPREPERIWERHLLNSAALAGAVADDAAVIDVGSGAGLPGVVVAIARPLARVTLVEPMQRRADFLAEVADTLGLDVSVVCARAETLTPAIADVVLARAVAPLVRLIPLTLPLLRPAGTLLALKGRSAATEVEQARAILRKWPGAHAAVGTVAYAGVESTVIRIELSARGPARKAVRR